MYSIGLGLFCFISSQQSNLDHYVNFISPIDVVKNFENKFKFLREVY